MNPNELWSKPILPTTKLNRTHYESGSGGLNLNHSSQDEPFMDYMEKTRKLFEWREERLKADRQRRLAEASPEQRVKLEKFFNANPTRFL